MHQDSINYNAVTMRKLGRVRHEAIVPDFRRRVWWKPSHKMKLRFYRLANVIEKFEGTNPKKLNMGVITDLNGEKGMDPSPSCKSVGCAMGWSPAALPSLVRWKTDYVLNNDDEKVILDHNSVVLIGDQDTLGLDAMIRLFGLIELEAHVLFGVGFIEYLKPKEVADGLRLFANTGVLPQMPHD